MKTVPKIVAIGGGEIREMETSAIDKRIVELTGKTQPKALFIPTASGDAPGYIDTFERVYGRTFWMPDAHARRSFKIRLRLRRCPRRFWIPTLSMLVVEILTR